jgi:hypothetical protein
LQSSKRRGISARPESVAWSFYHPSCNGQGLGRWSKPPVAARMITETQYDSSPPVRGKHRSHRGSDPTVSSRSAQLKDTSSHMQYGMMPAGNGQPSGRLDVDGKEPGQAPFFALSRGTSPTFVARKRARGALESRRTLRVSGVIVSDAYTTPQQTAMVGSTYHCIADAQVCMPQKAQDSLVRASGPQGSSSADIGYSLPRSEYYPGSVILPIA